MNNAKPNTIVVMGLNKKDGKPRAVAYPANDLDTATKSAAKWGLRVGRAEGDASLALVKDLPHGSLFPSHKMEPPAIDQETYNLLLKAIKYDPPPPAGPKSETAKPPLDLWENLAVGDVVIAPDRDPNENGYWAATILSISKDQLKLRFVDSKLAPFTARRHSVAVLRPKQ